MTHRKFLPVIPFVGALWATGALAEEPEAPPEPEEVTVVNDGTIPTRTSFEIGLAYLGAAEFQRVPEINNFGFGVGIRKEYLISQAVHFNVQFSLGSTALHRSEAVIAWGTNHGRWTTEGFGGLARWIRNGRDDDSRSARLALAIWGYILLPFSYILTPVAYVLSPFAAQSNLNIGPTLSAHAGADNLNVYAELGVGGMIYAHPEYGSLESASGPLGGVGVMFDKMAIEARLMVSPVGFHTPSAGGPSEIYAGEVMLKL